ncbi:DUF1120 domain-containing protein [Enterobacter chuandaensis]|uniref:DUF1120 domain-containing protein n=1 Tax=Enterobacter chuandaensis TaxID=2497875 RepID=UPI0039C454C6
MNAMFKKGMLASVLAVAASSAMAASSIDIQVTGKIVPASCTPAFISGGGIADFGTMKAADLNDTTVTSLGDTKIIPISITCESPTRIGVTFNDAHADSAPTADLPVFYGNQDFALDPASTAGLGMYNGKKIGAYSMGIQKDAGTATNDTGDNLYPIFQTDASLVSGWGNKSGVHYLQINTDKSETYSFTNVLGGDAPVAQKQINFNVGIMAQINPTNDLNITDEVTLDGLTNVELVYL